MSIARDPSAATSSPTQAPTNNQPEPWHGIQSVAPLWRSSGRGFRCRRKHRTLSSHFDRLRSDRRRYSICHPVSRNISDWWIGHRSGNLRKSDTPQRVDVGCHPYGYPVAYLASTERRVRSVPVPSPPSLPELSLSLSWWQTSSPPFSPERPLPPISSPPLVPPPSSLPASSAMPPRCWPCQRHSACVSV